MTDPRPRSTSPFPERWFENNYSLVLYGLLLVAIVTRVALVIGSPRPFGYVWDLYHEAVLWTYFHGRLPLPNDCGECYHPPLFLACGVPLYALGASVLKGGFTLGLRFLSLFSMGCSAIVIYYCHKILKMFTGSRPALLLGLALALVFPCLFISSYGAENDILLAALMSAFFYRLCLYNLHPSRFCRRDAVILGILAGLSALTKYSGWLTVITAALVMGPRLLFGHKRLRTARDLMIIVAVVAAVCGWHYARNISLRHKALLGPPWDPNVFTVDTAKLARNWKRYDFRSFKVNEVLDLYRPENIGQLNDFPVYDSVFTTLHALAWTDMSFFSVPSRHGWKLPEHYGEGSGVIPMVADTPASQPRVPIYPTKRVSRGLIEAVLRLGIIPTLLALVGFATTVRRRALRPFVVYTCASLGVYTWWVLAQPAWALKTKYILFLLPAYIVYVMLGLNFVYRRDRRLGHAAAVCLIAAMLASEAYLWMFALG
jgi:hypothetical protein